MASLVVMYWRDIPAQVIVEKGRGRRREAAKVELSKRFIAAIDAAAMKGGAEAADDYLEDWRRFDPVEVADDGMEDTAAAKAAKDADVVLLFLGMNSNGNNGTGPLYGGQGSSESEPRTATTLSCAACSGSSSARATASAGAPGVCGTGSDQTARRRASATGISSMLARPSGSSSTRRSSNSRTPWPAL